MSYFRLEDCCLLVWKRAGALDYPDMVKIPAQTGPSSFFHALLQSYNRVYIEEELDGKNIERDDYVRSFRVDLAEKLKIKSEYGRLQDSVLRPILSRDKDLNIEKLVEAIEDYNHEFDLKWIGFICYILDIDIYILEEETWTVYLYNSEEETYFLRPGHRNVVVILKSYRGYSTVGLITNDEDAISTYFDPKCNFILTIRQTLRHQRKLLQKHYQRRPATPPTIPHVSDLDRLIEPNLD